MKDSYEIQGPIGKGLGLTSESKGQHLAFSAGTGVLVFIDLVARMLLGQKNLIPKEQMLNDDFSLVLYVGFESRN